MNLKIVTTFLYFLILTQVSLSAKELSQEEIIAKCNQTLKEDIANIKDLGTPKLSNKNSANIVLFGDTQKYTQRRETQPILDMMTSWVATNQKKLNIKALLHVGDIVEFNNTLAFAKEGVNQNSVQMWESVSNAFKRLDNRIPYILCTGNHDYANLKYLNQESKNTSLLTKYFNPTRNSKNQISLLKIYAPKNQREQLDNALYKIEIGGKWDTIYVLSLEYIPRKEVIEWANSLLKKYENKTVILLTHMFIDDTAKLSSTILWEELVRKSPCIKLILCGHFCQLYSPFNTSVAFKEFQKDNGKKVKAMMFNPQAIGFGNGGDGWLRLLELQPDGKTIKVSTYSPLFAISPMTKHLAWRTAPYDMFSFNLEND